MSGVNLLKANALQTSFLTGIGGLISYYIYNFQNKNIPKNGPTNMPNINEKEQLIIMSNQPFYSDIVQYIYVKYESEIKQFTYQEEKINYYNEWKYNDESNSMKVLLPIDTRFTIEYNGLPISIDISMVFDGNLPFKIMESVRHATTENFVQKMILESDTKEPLIQFIDEAREYIKKESDNHRKASKETMCVFYYKKDYWVLLSKAPKRPIDTIYLKEGVRDKLIEDVEEFFSPDTRDIYLSYGIPYKSVNMIYGPPGSGKTTTIKGIASVLDCDVYILPITKDMVDADLVGAFTHINNDKEEEKQRIIVIEDIDTLFDDRKQGDKDNGITLQAFLNCLDGFTCIEGTMLFITANKPEVLDYALLRSCRIDNKIELGYADKYQTKEIFKKMLPDQIDIFDKFYSQIEHRDYTIAMLQEYLFYNRKCEDDILHKMDDFIEIIEKNDPKNFEILKEANKNFYS